MGLVIAGVLLLGLVGGAFAYRNGPTSAVHNYFTATLINHDAQAAYDMLCPGTRGTVTVASLQKSLDQLKTLGTYDISGLTYSLLDEQFLGNAHVVLGGSLAFKDLKTGKSITSPIQSTKTKPVTLHSQGLGWCLDATSS